MESQAKQHRAVIFADLAGFTALTEAHGDEEAVALVQEFAQLIPAKLPANASLVKIVGDAAMIVADDCADALRLAVELEAASEDLPGRPALRVGIHAGELVERDGDYWGHTVNVAARVAGEARPSEILITEAVRDQVASSDPELDAQLIDRGERQLRNVSRPIRLYALLAEDGSYHTDPVCRMRVRESESVGSLTVDGESYYFCSLRCVSSFLGSRSLD